MKKEKNKFRCFLFGSKCGSHDVEAPTPKEAAILFAVKCYLPNKSKIGVINWNGSEEYAFEFELITDLDDIENLVDAFSIEWPHY